MKTLNDFKARLTPGLTFYCENFAYPWMTGQRTVLKIEDHGFHYTTDFDSSIRFSLFMKKNRKYQGNRVIFLNDEGKKRYVFVFPQQRGASAKPKGQTVRQRRSSKKDDDAGHGGLRGARADATQ